MASSQVLHFSGYEGQGRRLEQVGAGRPAWSVLPARVVPTLLFKGVGSRLVLTQLRTEQEALKHQLAEDREHHAVQLAEAERVNEELRHRIRRLQASAAEQSAPTQVRCDQCQP